MGDKITVAQTLERDAKRLATRKWILSNGFCPADDVGDVLSQSELIALGWDITSSGDWKPRARDADKRRIFTPRPWLPYGASKPSVDHFGWDGL